MSEHAVHGTAGSSAAYGIWALIVHGDEAKSKEDW